MSRLDEDKVKLLIHKIGLDYKLQDEVIRKIVNSPYKFTRETIANLDISPDITEEEFNKLKTNFIYLYIGKLYTSYDIYKKLKNLSNKRWKKE
jgi:hypothetical protein